MAERLVAEVDLDKIAGYKGVAILPVLMCFDKWLFCLDTWDEFVKIFYYLLYKTEDGKDAIEINVGKNRLDNSGIYLLSSPSSYSRVQKFSSTLYVRVDETVSYRNVLFPLEIREIAKAHTFRLWVRKATTPKEDVGQLLTNTIVSATKKGREDRYTLKSTKYFIAHINGECLSEAEKFYLRIEKEYDKKILLGDIITTEREDEILKQYMQVALRSLVHNSSSMFRPSHEKVFAYGLVRFAMKYYSQSKFWPYFKDEFGIEFNANRQGELHEVFRRIMVNTGKTYDDSLARKIDNINLHSFVVDKCADQLFDYLFDFWRIDLQRNLDNLQGKEGRENFNALTTELRSNNERSVADVMKHTSMALVLNEKSCKLRIRRILSIIDDCFWNGKIVPSTGNRINELLRTWMAQTNGKFRKEYKYIVRNHGARGESLLLRPQLFVKYRTGTFALKLPREILRGCSKEEYPVWHITDGAIPKEIKPEILEGKIGLYTEEVEIAIPETRLHNQFSMVLQSELRKYASFSIKEEQWRFFNASGKQLDLSRPLPGGTVFCYSKNEIIPQILYEKQIIAQSVGSLYFGQYELEKGNLIRLTDERVIQVGEALTDGLQGGIRLVGVSVLQDNNKYSVFSSLPRIIFKAPKSDIEGIGIQIRSRMGEQFLRATDRPYITFRLDDSFVNAYAYIIELADYIEEDGCYTVGVNIPNNRSQYVYDFCYIRGFDYHFDGAPYIFKDTASIVFDKSTKVSVDADEWEILGANKVLTFIFDEANKDCPSYVKDGELFLNYDLSGLSIPLCISIPSLRWKFDKTSAWSYRQPSNMRSKEVPAYIYMDGPFDFNDNGTKIYVDAGYSSFGDNESELFAEKVKEGGYFAFRTANLKSWFTHDVDKRTIFFGFKDSSIAMFDVICRSIIISHSLSGDFSTNMIYGFFDIIGDSEYVAEIKYGEDVICQDVPIENGELQIETNLKEGTYSVKIFEIEEDDSGFESFSFLIASFQMKLVDVNGLENSIIHIQYFQDKSKRFKPIVLENDYQIRKLSRIGSYQDVIDRNIQVIGLWSLNIDDEAEMHGCVFYVGELGYINWKGNYSNGFKVLVIFKGNANISEAIILREEDGEYLELIYDRMRQWLLRDETQIDKFERVKNIQVLYDDFYSCHISIEEDKSQIFKPTAKDTDIFLGAVLSIEIAECLQEANIVYLSDLRRTSEYELLRINGMDESRLAEIKDMCAQYGILLDN